MYDTLEYVRRLEAVGVPREQAETQVRILAEVINTNLSTKQDLKDQTLATSAEFAAVHVEFARVDEKMKSLENRIVLKSTAATATLMTLLIAILKFI